MKNGKSTSSRKTVGLFAAIVSLITLLFIAAMVIFFVIIPGAREKKDNEPVQDEKTIQFVKYGKGEIPEDFVQYLTAYEQESKTACEKYGTALTVGKKNISMPELLMVYVDNYAAMYNEAKDDAELYQRNIRDFPFDCYPDEKQYSPDMTWEDYLSDKSVKQIQSDEYFFDLALKNDFRPSDKEINDISNNYGEIVYYSQYMSDSIDKTVVGSYTEGVTLNMFAARTIIHGYAEAYKNVLKNGLAEKVSKDKIQSAVEKSGNEYKVFEGRLYLIANGTDFTGCRTEDEFIRLAAKDAGADTAKAETATDWYYSTYDRMSSVLGNENADYLFSSERKPGEILTIGYNDNSVAVYIDKPAYLGNSVSCVILTAESDMGNDKAIFRQTYDKWLENGGTKELLVQICDLYENPFDLLPYGDSVIYPGEMITEVEKWLRSPDRKQGDSECFFLDGMNVIVLFESNNKDDLKCYKELALLMSADDFESRYSPDKKHLLHTDDAEVKKASEMSKEKIAKYISG